MAGRLDNYGHLVLSVITGITTMKIHRSNVLPSSIALVLGCGLATASEDFHHGAKAYVPELHLSSSSGAVRSTREGRLTPEGRFGRMFGIGEEYVKGEPLRPHPSPNYDLRRLGRAEGPMQEDDDEVVGDGIAPAGITFLGQFVDHDITLDVSTSLDEPAIPEQIPNHRTVSLDLDCVYGVGPEGSPYLYDFPKLAVGDEIGGSGRFDLPRFNGTALIGDPRNDENAIVSQIQAAFIAFHNAMVDALHEQSHPDEALEDLSRSEKAELFEEARDHVIHYYHRLLVEDFLPQVIGADRTIELAHEGRRWYFPEGFYDNDNASIQLPWMPVEFSVAAYRFGHSQVRSKYHLNSATLDIPLFSAGEGESNLMGFTPIAESHVINWRYFFPVDGAEILMQKARKIDTKLPAHLFGLDKVNVVPPGGLGSLAARNLNRGRVYRLPSGQSIAKAMGEAHVFADEDTIQTLAVEQTPLWYYILQEADHVSTAWNSDYKIIVEMESSALESANSVSTQEVRAGKGYLPEKAVPLESVTNRSGNILGPVGGAIVGEVIYGLIDHYRERTGKGLDYNVKIVMEDKDTGIYGRRVQMQHMLGFAGVLEFEG